MGIMALTTIFPKGIQLILIPPNRPMPRVSSEHKQLYKSKIRGLLSQNPQITQRELQAQPERQGFRLDRKYLGQLLKSIYAERIKRADT